MSDSLVHIVAYMYQNVHSEKSIIGPILTHYWIRMISSLVGNMGNSIGSMI